MLKHLGVFYDLRIIYILLYAFVGECNW